MESKMYSFSICVDNIPDTHKAIGKDGKIYLNNLILPFRFQARRHQPAP